MMLASLLLLMPTALPVAQEPILRDPTGHRARVADAQRQQWEFLFAPPRDPSLVVDAMLADAGRVSQVRARRT